MANNKGLREQAPRFDRETLREALRLAQGADEAPEQAVYRAKLYAEFLSQ